MQNKTIGANFHQNKKLNAEGNATKTDQSRIAKPGGGANLLHKIIHVAGTVSESDQLASSSHPVPTNQAVWIWADIESNKIDMCRPETPILPLPSPNAHADPRKFDYSSLV